MLEIKELFKEQMNYGLNHISFKVDAGNSVSIECSNEASDLLTNLILGRETPTKGEIFIAGQENKEYIKKGIKNIGIILREEGFYNRLSVEEYLKFYSNISCNSVNYKEIMMKLGLLDIGDIKIGKLTYSQKRRLSFARERLKDLRLLIFQEPILSMDRDGGKIILENIEELKAKGVAVLCTSVSFKDIMLLGGQAYSLNENAFEELHQHNDEKAVNIDVENSIENKPEERPIYKIEKITAKVEDRILLFDPIEIDYIESEQGVSQLCIRGDKFPCTLSLAELEDRLKHFGFFRCHRSYLVNLQRVREVVTWTRNSYSLNLDDKNKSTIPLSKGRMDELKEILNL